MKRWYLFACWLIIGCSSILTAEEPSLGFEEFLWRLRAPKQNINTYAKLSGSLTHQRNNAAQVLEYPIYFGMAVTPQKTMAQLLLNRAEGYYVGQTGVTEKSGGTTSVIPMQKGGYDSPIAANVGLEPADMAMSFVFFEPVRELERDSFRTIACRVLLLKDPKSDTFVKLNAAEKYFFPLKAEFYKGEPSKDNPPFRTLEVSSFKKQNDLYYVRKLDLYGPGWRTLVDFTQAEIGAYEGEIPSGVIRTL